MSDKHRIKFGLVCLVMAALTGLIGFVIIYHYATFERPLQRFAIVIDAGSTQTRSSLYALQIDVPEVLDWAHSDEEPAEGSTGGRQRPLNEFVQVKQVGTCINGGPLTGIESIHDARTLIGRCLRKFALYVTRLNFEDTIQLQDQDDLDTLDSDEVGRRMAALDKRVNSVTRLYLGATAGMRALGQLNSTVAREKIRWISEALGESNELLASKLGNDMSAPYMNRAFVDVISGQDEATFGWISVNFVIGRLMLELPGLREPEPVEKHPKEVYNDLPARKHQRRPETVGTLELGGASAQMAFELIDGKGRSDGLEVRELDLFNSPHLLATRSDICLGMSQAILRTDMVLLRDSFEVHHNTSSDELPELELENPCLQNKVRRSVADYEQVEQMLQMPCLRGTEHQFNRARFKDFVESRSVIRFVGTGDVIQCRRLLDNLLDPDRCKRYFSLCPTAERLHRASSDNAQTFVTISGYNKALKILDLHKVERVHPSELEQVIADRLGGYSIDHSELVHKTREFCETDVSMLPIKYPNMNQNFYPVNCLQLVYINKLLTEFYQFEPSSSDWNGIKFLLFPAKEASHESLLAANRLPDRNDIGWTLGLLLNATSHKLSGCDQQMDVEDGILYHHGATVAFIVRASLLLMLACCLLSICLLLFGALLIRKRHRSAIYLNNYYTGA